MSYGIYDKASHTLVETNLPASTTIAMVEKMTAEAPEGHEGYDIAILRVDGSWCSVSTHRELIVAGEQV
jgi:hypothetical protein